MVNELLTMPIFTTKEVSSTARRPCTWEGGMRNEIHDMRTVMPETKKLTGMAVLMVLTMTGDS